MAVFSRDRAEAERSRAPAQLATHGQVAVSGRPIRGRRLTGELRQGRTSGRLGDLARARALVEAREPDARRRLRLSIGTDRGCHTRPTRPAAHGRFLRALWRIASVAEVFRDHEARAFSVHEPTRRV